MKYSILNFKLFIYLLICKMWSSSMHLWLWLWIKDILVYSKWVLNIKFLFVSKSFWGQNLRMQFMIFPPDLVLYRCSYWHWMAVSAALIQARNLGIIPTLSLHHSFALWKSYFSVSHHSHCSTLWKSYFSVSRHSHWKSYFSVSHHSHHHLSPRYQSLAWTIGITSQQL